jgi:8-oxo-dGTP pyrophosphatase MutT (NUDIX family)
MKMLRQGAGILFVTRGRPKLILVGRESYHRPGQPAALWGDFGGGVKRDETVDMAAAREAYEETAGLLFTYEDLLARICSQEFLLKIVHQFDPGYRYTLYVMDVNLDNRRNVPREFDRLYSYLKSRRVNPDRLIEKSQLDLLALNEVLEQLNSTEFFRPRLRTILATHWDEFAAALS